VKVKASGGDGGLNALVYDPPTTTNLNVVNAAQDAEIVVSGYTIKSADNAVEDAVDGLTLNLKQEDEGTTVTFSVANDDTGVQQKATAFVTAYNSLMSTIADLRSYNATTQVAGPLLGDSMLRGIEEQVRRTVSSVVTGGTSKYTTLASLGISTQANGTLALDATKFAAERPKKPVEALAPVPTEPSR